MAEGLRTFTISDSYMTGRITQKGTSSLRKRELCDVKNSRQVKQVVNLPIIKVGSTIQGCHCANNMTSGTQSVCIDNQSEWEHCNCTNYEDSGSIRCDTDWLSRKDIMYVRERLLRLPQAKDIKIQSPEIADLKLFDIDDTASCFYPSTYINSHFLLHSESLEVLTISDLED